MQVRAALGAKHVICVCSSYDSAGVMDAAQRLLDCADVLRGVVDLSGEPFSLLQNMSSTNSHHCCNMLDLLDSQSCCNLCDLVDVDVTA